MAISADHLLAPAHAHLNLTGWVGLSIFAFYYHLVPEAAQGLLPRLHLGTALAGAATFAPGIAVAISRGDETLASVGALLTLASLLLFAAVVVRRRPTRLRSGQAVAF